MLCAETRLRCCNESNALPFWRHGDWQAELARLFGMTFLDVLLRGSQFRVESVLLRITKFVHRRCVSPSPLLLCACWCWSVLCLAPTIMHSC